MSFSQLLQFGFFLFSFALNKTTENFINIQTNAERVRSKIKLIILFLAPLLIKLISFLLTLGFFSHVFGPLEGQQFKVRPLPKISYFLAFEISFLRNKPHRSLEHTLKSDIRKNHHDMWHISALTNR